MNDASMRSLKNIVMVALLFAVTACDELSGGAHNAAANPHAGHAAAAPGPDTQAQESEFSHFTCPMHPSVESMDPGQCPICSMDLVGVARADGNGGMITIDEGRRQLIGVKTAAVRRAQVVVPIHAVGKLTYDETRLVDVSLKYDAWIGEVFADYTGVAVEAGDPLFTVYSPELLSAQEELLESLRREKTQISNPLLAVARRRLRLWNLSDQQIDRLADRGTALEYIPILSPATGTVIAKHVVDGSAVRKGGMLFRIADLSSLWVEAEVYEEDAGLVQIGQTARVTLSYLPETVYEATIAYVYPYVDSSSRTVRVRLELPNADGALRPDMYANVALSIPYGERIVVPEEAVVRGGETSVVFVDLGQGRLKPRAVTLGRKTNDGLIVASGLEAGEIVVTSGNFLVASESKLRTGLDKW
jgi:Cu(I)/Ag(I) efflux system membrane fusion protein